MAWLFDKAIHSDSSFVTIKSASDYININETGKRRLEIQHGLLVVVRMLLAPEVKQQRRHAEHRFGAVDLGMARGSERDHQGVSATFPEPDDGLQVLHPGQEDGSSGLHRGLRGRVKYGGRRDLGGVGCRLRESQPMECRDQIMAFINSSLREKGRSVPLGDRAKVVRHSKSEALVILHIRIVVR